MDDNIESRSNEVLDGGKLKTISEETGDNDFGNAKKGMKLYQWIVRMDSMLQRDLFLSRSFYIDEIHASCDYPKDRQYTLVCKAKWTEIEI